MSRLKTLVTRVRTKHEQRYGVIDKGATYLYFDELCPKTSGVMFLHKLPYYLLYTNPVFRYGFVVQTTRGWPCLDLNDLPQN